MDYHQRMKNKYFKVRKTLLEMLEDRHYNVPKSLYVGFNEFSAIYDNNNFDFTVEHSETNNQMYITFFTELKNFTKKDFYNVISKLDLDNESSVIIVLRDKCNQTIMKELLLEKNKNIEIFIIDRLLINITKHDLVPKHELLSKDEIKDLLIKYKSTINQLPKVFKTDPISRYYGAKTGDIFRIYRKSNSMGEKVAYRYVK